MSRAFKGAKITGLQAMPSYYKREGLAKEVFPEPAEATKLLPKRWEATQLPALFMLSQRNLTEANHFVESALKRLPLGSADKLSSLTNQIRQLSSIGSSPSFKP